MPIPLTCACGRSLRIRDALAGRKVKCPGCGRALAVPAPAAEEGPLEVLPAAPPPQAVTNVPPRPRQEEPLDVVPVDAPADERAGGYAIQAGPPPAEPRPRRRRRRRVPRWEEEEARHERPAPRTRIVFEEGWFGSTNAGVLGGVLMILIAVAWFAVGMAFGRIFFYPVILVVIGVAAFVKGLLEA